MKTCKKECSVGYYKSPTNNTCLKVNLNLKIN
jgi:hypothetical protein